MTIEQKYLISISLLPVLADFLEDLPMNREVKMMREIVVNSIRSLDRMLLEGIEDDESKQLIDIQLAFRQWCETNFK